MKNLYLTTSFIIGSISLLLTPAFAATPTWTFTPLTATTISLAIDATATIQYSVTNLSRKTHRLAMRSIAGINQLTTAGNCSNPFTLGYQQSCILTLEIVGNQLTENVNTGPVVCEQNSVFECYQPSRENSLHITRTAMSSTTLSASVSTLALSVNDTTTNAALTGTPRIITITNTGSSTASAVTYTPSPALPSGSTIAPASCGDITAGSSCTLTVTPGATPSATAGDTSPSPITLTISGTNTNALTPTLSILTYGSVYQSGYVFAVDDTTPSSQSIGGKIAALSDQLTPAAGVIWSSNGTGGDSANVANNNIAGVTNSSTNPPDACNGKSNGACNSNVIIDYYSPPTTTPAVNLAYYAAGVCSQYSGGSYTDWYLPSICEMGYDTLSRGTGCGTSGSPTMQNVTSNLVNSSVISLSGQYWTSTENAASPTSQAWQNSYFPPGPSFQVEAGKNLQNGVRCIRALS